MKFRIAPGAHRCDEFQGENHSDSNEVYQIVHGEVVLGLKKLVKCGSNGYHEKGWGGLRIVVTTVIVVVAI